MTEYVSLTEYYRLLNPRDPESECLLNLPAAAASVLIWLRERTGRLPERHSQGGTIATARGNSWTPWPNAHQPEPNQYHLATFWWHWQSEQGAWGPRQSHAHATELTIIPTGKNRCQVAAQVNTAYAEPTFRDLLDAFRDTWPECAEAVSEYAQRSAVAEPAPLDTPAPPQRVRRSDLAEWGADRIRARFVEITESSRGRPTQADFASELSTTPRTLQRHFASIGLTWPPA